MTLNLNVNSKGEEMPNAFQFADYQQQAARTANTRFTLEKRLDTDFKGLAGEIGEIMSELQHAAEQEREPDWENIREELGDCMWRIADICSAMGWHMGMIAAENIAKLQRRHPDGFSAQTSAARADKRPVMRKRYRAPFVCEDCHRLNYRWLNPVDNGRHLNFICDYCMARNGYQQDMDISQFEVGLDADARRPETEYYEGQMPVCLACEEGQHKSCVERTEGWMRCGCDCARAKG